MPIYDDVFAKMLLLDGSTEDWEKKQLMGRLAADELQSQLRSGLDVEEIREIFVTAAAMLAMGMYLDGMSISGVQSFAAGDFSVSMKGGDGYRYRSMARQIMAPYTFEGFAFMGVRG